MKLKVRVAGNSICVVLPKVFLRRLNVKKGDYLTAVATPEGYLLTPFDRETQEQLKVGRRLMAKHRNTLRDLEKRW